MTALIIILVVLFIILWPRVIKRFYHRPAPPIVRHFLDSRLRRWMQPTPKLMERSGISPGMTVLDLGCGSGAFTIPVARAVGEQGKVYAFDIQPAMLRQIERKLSKAENQDIRNIELKQGSAYELPFTDGSLDIVCMVTVLEEIPDRGKALREVSRVLKPGGILAVTELFIDPDYPLRATTIRQCQDAGFVLEASAGNWWNYTVRLRKPTEKG